MVMLGFTVIEMVTEVDDETCERSWWLEHGDLKLQVVVQKTFVKDGNDHWQAMTANARSRQMICVFKSSDPDQNIDDIGERILKLALWYMDEELPELKH